MRKTFTAKSLHDKHWTESQLERNNLNPLPRTLIARTWVEKNRPQILLDIGCGTGVFAQLVNEIRPKIEIHGLDFSREALRKASQFYDLCWNINIDVEDVPMEDNKYDAVLCMEVLEHVYDVTHILREIYRLLKPTGKALISVPNLAYWRYRLQLLRGVLPHPEIFNPEHIHAFVLKNIEKRLTDSSLHVNRCWGYGDRLKFFAKKFPQLFSSTIFVECYPKK